MADCNAAFKTFHRTIAVPEKTYQDLKAVRDRIRNLIIRHFAKALPATRPRFKLQGSVIHKTLVVPLAGECDLDDGTYITLNGKWPVPQTALGWIHGALKSRYPKSVVYKRACVELCRPGRFRIDLPLYIMKDDKPFIADTGPEGWHKSDTGELDDWFAAQYKKKGPQLKRLVRYIKAWADYQSGTWQLPSNLVLQMYVINAFKKHDRDDFAFARSLAEVAAAVKRSWKLVNPMEPNEIMTRRMTDEQKKDGRQALMNLAAAAGDAVACPDARQAISILSEQFGSRFPVQ